MCKLIYIYREREQTSIFMNSKYKTYLLFGGGRSNISRWLMVGMEPCKGRTRNLLVSPSKLFPFIISFSLLISSQPVRNTRIAPSPSLRQIYSIVVSTYKIIYMNTDLSTPVTLKSFKKKEFSEYIPVPNQAVTLTTLQVKLLLTHSNSYR